MNAIKAIARAIPTALILALLAAIGYWGHRNGWTLPKLSQLRAAQTEPADWCVEHNVPESRCIACNPQLVGATMDDWCREHGLPESKCAICHPDILTRGVAGDWCQEHGLPESNCTICHPEIAIKGTAAPASDIKVTAHGEGEHAHEHAARNPATCQMHQMRVQFASVDAIRKAGVFLAPVQQLPMASQVRGNAELTYNRDRLANVSSRAAGTLWRVDAQLGQRVKKGEVIALVDALEVGKAKAELLAAQAAQDARAKALDRIQSSTASGFRTQADLQAAEAELKESRVRVYNARQSLINLGLPLPQGAALDESSIQFLGLPAGVIQGLDAQSSTANLLPLTAPFDGIVIERTAVAGEFVEPGKPLLVIADTSLMWLTIDLPLADARRVKIGQDVSFVADGADEAVAGKLAWISTAVDHDTRTVKVRADIENPDAALLANTFGLARVTIRREAKAVAVPDDALQWEGCCFVVFVRQAEDIFQVRKVKLGARSNGFTEIAAGLLPGEIVASAGSSILKSEILKHNLGAGCAGE